MERTEQPDTYTERSARQSFLSDLALWARRDALRDAMQEAWDEFCSDTGCHPDVLWREGRKTFADFGRGNFSLMVACALDREGWTLTSPKTPGVREFEEGYER